MKRIVTLTLNPTIDVSTAVDRVVPERKLRCEAPTREPGGGGLNVSRAIRELGGESTALWTSGGATGQLLGELLDREEVTHRPLPVEGITRENLIVFEHSSEEQYRFGMPGPELRPDEARACLEAVVGLDPAPDYLVASGSLPPGVDDGFYADLVRAVPSGTRTILDTSGGALRRAAEAKGVHVLKPNLRELAQLTGREELDGDAAIAEAAGALIERGATEVVVVSLGAGGAILVTSEGCRHLRSPTVPIRSKVGAGDSMVAGLTYALARDWDLEDAVRYAIAAGAAAVMTEGTRLCRRKDVETLFDAIST